MLCKDCALHGESTGIVRRLPDDDERGYGPSYVSDKKHAFVVFLVDSHWPQFYLIRASDMEEALEHAEIVLCPIDEEAEARCANGEDFETVAWEHDVSITADGRIRTTWALRFHTLA